MINDILKVLEIEGAKYFPEWKVTHTGGTFNLHAENNAMAYELAENKLHILDMQGLGKDYIIKIEEVKK